MGFVNIFYYENLPQKFHLWNIPQYTFCSNESVLKNKIFNLNVVGHGTSVFTIIASANALSKLHLCCKKRKKSCEFTESCCKYFNDCRAYENVKEAVGRRLKSKRTTIGDCYVILYHPQYSSQSVETLVNSLLLATTHLVLAESLDESKSIMKKLRSNDLNALKVICCGNPLEWNHNYIGKNTRVLYRK